MTPDEVERLVRIAASFGVSKVKITGGEPLVREDIVDIVSRVSGLVDEVSLTTNGSKLAKKAADLKTAGLKRVNVSLHTLNPVVYAYLCGIDRSRLVIQGIVSSVEAGLEPVKVNMVVLKGENEEEIPAMIQFCSKVGAVLQLIEYETDKESSNGCKFAEKYYSLREVEEDLARNAIEKSHNDLHRRGRYRINTDGSAVTVEVVRPMHNTEFCANCKRIRLSSDGKLKPCLLDPSGSVDLLTPLRNGASDEELRSLFAKGVSNRKPYWR
jgi:cyclic pyranopterin phosphate synthase